MRPDDGLSGLLAAERPSAVPGGDGAVLDWAGATDVGHIRAHNEDSLLVEPPLFVVADGMGGHEAGDVASALTVERLGTLGRDGPLSVDEVAAELQHVNSLLRDAVGSTDDTTMGTTAVGLVVVRGSGVPTWLVFNIGDSRAYCYADGALVQISRDHSYVQELVDAGELAAEAAATHPQRHVVTRALGVDGEMEADYWLRPLKPGERFLLCSDGLSGEVDDDAIARVLGAGRPAAETVGDLVALALAGGGRDNITAMVVDVVSVPGWDDETTGGRTTAPSTVPAEAELDTAERTLRAVPPGPPPPPAEPDGEVVVDEEEERSGPHPPPAPSAGRPAAPTVPPPAERGSGVLIAWVPPIERTPAAATEPGPAKISEVPCAALEPSAPSRPSAGDPPSGALIEGMPPGLHRAAPEDPDPSVVRPPHPEA